MNKQDVMYWLEQYSHSKVCRDALALLREKDEELAIVKNERDEARRDCGMAERNHFESMESVKSLHAIIDEKDAEIERLTRICRSYALRYGTVRDQSTTMEHIRVETITELLDRIEAKILARGELKPSVLVEDLVAVVEKMTNGWKYQEYVATVDDMRSLYNRVLKMPHIKQYRGYTETKSYGCDDETRKIIKKDGEFWFDNPSFRGG